MELFQWLRALCSIIKEKSMECINTCTRREKRKLVVWWHIDNHTFLYKAFTKAHIPTQSQDCVHANIQHHPPTPRNPPHIPMAENNIKKENILFEEVSLTWICFEGLWQRVKVCVYHCMHTHVHTHQCMHPATHIPTHLICQMYFIRLSTLRFFFNEMHLFHHVL